MAEYDDIPIGAVAGVGVLGTVAAVAIILLLLILYYRTAAAHVQEKDIAQQSIELRTVLGAQQEKLAGYRWIDREKGVVGVPIERAMELVIDDYRAGDQKEKGHDPSAK